MPSDEFLARWCSTVPGLEAVSTNSWQLATDATVSFPSDGLAALKAVENSSYWFRHRNRVICSVVQRFDPNGLIFDIGGGTGVVSGALVEKGVRCVVVEPDSGGIENATARGLATIKASYEHLRIPDGSLPAAALFDVLEHIPDDTQALSRLFDEIQPGGLIYITVPAYNFLWSPEDNFSGHFRRYTLASLGGCLEQAGFDLLYGTYMFAALVPAIMLFRAMPGWVGIGSSTNAIHQAQSDHRLPNGLAGRTLQRSFDWEFDRISSGRKVDFGSSVLVVARKVF